MVNYFSPKRICAQPLSIPHSRFHSFDSFKSFWQLVLLVAVSFILNSLFGFSFQAETHTLWYDWMRPANAQLHADYMQRLTEAKARSKNKIRAVQWLVHRLRLVKSPAELERMQIAGKVTSQVWFLQKKTVFERKTLSSSRSVGSLRLCVHCSNLTADERPALTDIWWTRLETRSGPCEAR